MKQYIPKSALVAEIEKRIEGINPLSQRVGVVGCSNTIKHLRGILSFIDSLQEEPVSEDLPHIRHRDTLDEYAYQCAYDMSNDWAIENPTWHDVEDACKLGAKWQEANLWKPADGDDLPEIDREVVVLTQPYSDDNEHLRVAFAHRPNKYAKVWNSDLGEEQVIEIERYGKGEWNIPFVKYWLDVKLPKEIEL